MPLLLGCRAGGNQTHASASGAGGLVGMRHQQQDAVSVMSQQPPTFFILAVLFVKNRQRQRIQEYRCRLLERRAMLIRIGQRFRGIPLKIVNDARHARPFLALRLGQLRNRLDLLLPFWCRFAFAGSLRVLGMVDQGIYLRHEQHSQQRQDRRG